ncbi:MULTISPECIES: hypothetical protein [Paenibacillus]|uniref:hypothetical protein n=1 Tax=Paenibacillus TaxID=44249 RepID=UPI0022B8EC22|nr:hypothetical protein [Paenibacillus caseinilyticus]MCZ8521179.1 hypothetical protein [Paenibacillus caseinilyticus]
MKESKQAPLPEDLSVQEQTVLSVFTRHPYLSEEQDLTLVSRVTGLSVIQIELAVRSLKHKRKWPAHCTTREPHT